MSNSTAPISSPGTSTTSSILSTESSSASSPTIATSTSTAPTSVPPTTQLVTSVVTASASNGGSSQPPSTVVITTQLSTPSTDTTPTDTGSSSSSSSSTAVSSQNKGSSNGLSAGGKTAIAVVIPVVVVALLLIAALFLWRKRKQRKNEEEERKKEMEEYGYNPNHDPTLPAVAATDEIAEDQSGYRGWGTTSNTTRKASTTMSGGVTQLSDGGHHSPGSPTQGASVSDHNSGDPLMAQQGRRETMDSETMGNLAASGPAAGAAAGGVKRGPSNASSAYSAGDRSANSGEARAQNPAGQQDYYTDNAYYQPGPYENTYGNGQQPVIRDNPARRNTRIERPDVFPHQGTSGIAQNF